MFQEAVWSMYVNFAVQFSYYSILLIIFSALARLWFDFNNQE